MKTKSTTTLLAFIIIASCHLKDNQEVKSDENLSTKNESNLLFGSWVEPNPINEKEMQGFKLKDDGTMESINLNTLIYKKWWKSNDKLFIVSESIGNASSSIDTATFEIEKVDSLSLELKGNTYNLSLKRLK